MWCSRLLVPVLLAAFLAGCASTPPPPLAAPVVGPATQADIDDLIYDRPVKKDAHPAHIAPLPVAAPLPAEPAPPLTPAMAFEGEPPYTLNAGDKLRIVVFGQEGLSNTYVIDGTGAITMPLIGAVRARGLTTNELARAIGARLRKGYIRDPHVAIEIDTYRPFFILGEVTLPGQYPYVPHMTVENAVAIAGGFSPRAYRWDMRIDRPVGSGVVRQMVPPLTRVRPGDTIIVKERWF
jgi:polysaccharide export outer membrane protein